MIKVPATCLACSAPYSGGAALPDHVLPPGRRVFYACGAALSVTVLDATIPADKILFTGCHATAAPGPAEADWPRGPAKEFGVTVGELACPGCGAVQSGAIAGPECRICGRPYFPAED